MSATTRARALSNGKVDKNSPSTDARSAAVNGKPWQARPRRPSLGERIYVLDADLLSGSQPPPCILRLQSVQRLPSGAVSSTSRGVAYLFHFTLNWKDLLDRRDLSESHTWPDLQSSPFMFGGHVWQVKGHVKTTPNNSSFLVLYPHTLLQFEAEEKANIKSPANQFTPTDIFRLVHQDMSQEEKSVKPIYTCHLPYKFILLCRDAYTRCRHDHERNLSVTTDDEGERFAQKANPHGLRLVIPIAQLEDSPTNDYVIDGHLHLRLICWPARTVYTVHTRCLELFPWHPSMETKRFGHTSWESKRFLFREAWWKIVLFPKGHGKESGQRLMVFLELAEMSSSAVSVDQPVAMDATLHIEHRKVPSAYTPGLQGSFSTPHALSHKFVVGELAGCRDQLLLQAEVERVVTTLDIVDGSVQGAWCQPTRFATSFSGGPEMWAWFMESTQSRLRPGNRSLSTRSLLHSDYAITPIHGGQISPRLRTRLQMKFSSQPNILDEDEDSL